jgi:membrane fusion protein, multidrug efflux system
MDHAMADRPARPAAPLAASRTDTLLFKGVIPNPILESQTAGGVKLRELVADEFVTVMLESVDPRQIIAVP